MFFDNLLLGTTRIGYIAGTGDGIVTVAGMPDRRDVLLLDALDFTIVAWQASLKNGHYLFSGLNANKKYIVMARDLPPDGVTQRYEPMVWDYVVPATDKTVLEQQELWQQMQGS